MLKEVIAVFDIGKTNKKFLLFDETLRIVHEEEVRFSEVTDDDGFHCDDADHIETWMKTCLSDTIRSGNFAIRAVNFATYGATLAYIGHSGERLTPLYNYLRPMPEGVIDGFYEKYGGVEEFSRKTASPALGMLNSGLQALWLKKTKPEVFSKIRSVLHLPQYLSYCLTGKLASEYTSIGCHTALWDFDNDCYHRWVADEGVPVPDPVSNEVTYRAKIEDQTLDIGIGIHDSSSSLVPYFKGSDRKFILISTGTWCIFMNPFNSEPLTADQLRKDTLCYMSIRQQQVKSSRLFLGHIHDVNATHLARVFEVYPDYYKKVKADRKLLSSLMNENRGRVFFSKGIPGDYLDSEADMSIFSSFNEAYHRLMYDLVDVAMESLNLIIPDGDQTESVYISGGFARNEIFVYLLAARLPDKTVYTSEIDNATALGAAMVVYEKSFSGKVADIDLGLKEITKVI